MVVVHVLQVVLVVVVMVLEVVVAQMLVGIDERLLLLLERRLLHVHLRGRVMVVGLLLTCCYLCCYVWRVEGGGLGKGAMTQEKCARHFLLTQTRK